jgi:hypothetical protein
MHTYLLQPSQLEGSGSRGAIGSYNKAGFEALSSQLEHSRIEDADQWVEQLYQKDAGIGVLSVCVLCVCV